MDSTDSLATTEETRIRPLVWALALGFVLAGSLVPLSRWRSHEAALAAFQQRLTELKQRVEKAYGDGEWELAIAAADEYLAARPGHAEVAEVRRKSARQRDLQRLVGALDAGAWDEAKKQALDLLKDNVDDQKVNDLKLVAEAGANIASHLAEGKQLEQADRMPAALAAFQSGISTYETRPQVFQQYQAMTELYRGSMEGRQRVQAVLEFRQNRAKYLGEAKDAFDSYDYGHEVRMLKKALALDPRDEQVQQWVAAADACRQIRSSTITLEEGWSLLHNHIPREDRHYERAESEMQNRQRDKEFMETKAKARDLYGRGQVAEAKDLMQQLAARDGEMRELLNQVRRIEAHLETADRARREGKEPAEVEALRNVVLQYSESVHPHLRRRASTRLDEILAAARARYDGFMQDASGSWQTYLQEGRMSLAEHQRVLTERDQTPAFGRRNNLLHTAYERSGGAGKLARDYGLEEARIRTAQTLLDETRAEILEMYTRLDLLAQNYRDIGNVKDAKWIYQRLVLLPEIPEHPSRRKAQAYLGEQH